MNLIEVPVPLAQPPVTHAALTSCVSTSTGEFVCNSGISGAGIAILVALGVFYLALIVVTIVAYVKIVTKAGYSGWWILLALVPIAGFVLLLIFAFSKWPLQREVEALRAQAYGGRSYGYGPRGPSSGGPGQWAQQPGPEGPLPSFGQWQSGASGPLPDSGGGSSQLVPQGAQGAENAATPGPTPPGWYPTPDGRLRYWSGTEWTDHYA